MYLFFIYYETNILRQQSTLFVIFTCVIFLTAPKSTNHHGSSLLVVCEHLVYKHICEYEYTVMHQIKLGHLGMPKIVGMSLAIFPISVTYS